MPSFTVLFLKESIQLQGPRPQKLPFLTASPGPLPVKVGEHDMGASITVFSQYTPFLGVQYVPCYDSE